MVIKKNEPKGRSDKRIWLAAPVLFVVVLLTCGWLAFCDVPAVLDNARPAHNDVQPLTMMVGNNKTVTPAASAASGLRAGYEHQGQAGKFYVVVRFEKQAPTKGRNRLSVIVLDTFRDKLKGATVKIEYLIPSLPGRPPAVYHESTARQEKDYYRADVNLSIIGEWIFRVKVSKGDQQGTFEFPVKVSQSSHGPESEGSKAVWSLPGTISTS